MGSCALVLAGCQYTACGRLWFCTESGIPFSPGVWCYPAASVFSSKPSVWCYTEFGRDHCGFSLFLSPGVWCYTESVRDPVASVFSSHLVCVVTLNLVETCGFSLLFSPDVWCYTEFGRDPVASVSTSHLMCGVTLNPCGLKGLTRD